MNTLEANFSNLVLSIASSATMALGLAPNAQNQKIETDLALARFNIDLLILLQTKTKGNLEKNEDDLLSSIVNDLQMKFIQTK